jgi:hypothetical protein
MPTDPSPEPRETISRFERLLADLARGGLDFAVVGGLAVILNGYPRLTLDADILVDAAPNNVRELLKYLADWGEGWARELTVEDFVPQEGSIRVSEDFDLDIFTQMRGKSLDDFRSNLRYVELHGVRVPVLDPASLIQLKSGSWREKDQLDVIAMTEILKRERDCGAS